MGHWEKDRYGEGVEEGEGQGGPQQGQGEDHKGAHEVHLERGPIQSISRSIDLPGCCAITLKFFQMFLLLWFHSL